MNVCSVQRFQNPDWKCEFFKSNVEKTQYFIIFHGTIYERIFFLLLPPPQKKFKDVLKPLKIKKENKKILFFVYHVNFEILKQKEDG